MVHQETSPQGERSINHQAAWWAGNVALRFEVYTQAEPYFDIYAEVFERLHLRGDEVVVDVGSNDGRFVFWLKNQNPKGQFIGVEPDVSSMPKFKNQRHVRFFRGLAKDLYGADNSVDVITSNFSMYFGDDQEDSLKEFKRVLKPGGRLALTTSGYFNKVRQRFFEQASAQKRGVQAPKMMNQNFDTDIAAQVLPSNFRHVFHGSYQGKMVFRTEQEALKYKHSFLSMAEFFDPPLGEQELNEVYAEVVAPVVSREIALLGQFEDFVQRDFFICSDDPLGLWMYDPRQIKYLYINGYHSEQLGADYLRPAA